MKKVVWKLLIGAAVLSALFPIMLTAFWVGRIDGALSPVRRVEIPMCANRETQIRESPTGYILGDVPAGAMLWFLKLDLPFAHVAYFDGSSWLEGTVPAFVLEVCNDHHEQQGKDPRREWHLPGRFRNEG